MKSSFRVLYIEDDAANRKLVRKLLEADGYEMFEAGNGLEGIQVAQQVLPDLVLMDLNMPGLDGCEVTTRLKSMAELAHIPVVALTAAVSAGIKERTLAAGCIGYIAKPIDVDQFSSEIATYLQGKRERLSHEVETRELRDYSQRLVERLEQQVGALEEANAKLAANLQEVARARDMALQADKVKTEFLHVMSHEMRTPLNAILGYSELMLMDTSKVSEEQAQDLRTIHEAGGGLLSIVNRILDFVQIESERFRLNLARFDMGDLLKQVMFAHQQKAAEKQLELALLKCEPAGSSYGDIHRLKHVIGALLSNAVTFAEHGQVSVECLQQSAPAGSKHVLEQVVLVRDSGPGVPEAQRDKLFEVFRQVDASIARAHGGLGLSLAMAQRIMALHGGRIWFEPGQQEGALFGVALPVKAVEADQ